jgi:hypothetical protein
MTFVAIAPFAWGKGTTADKAVKNAKANLSRSLLEPGKHEITVYRVAHFTSVDGLGRIGYKGAIPRKVETRHFIVRR